MMLYQILADAVLLLHLAFIIYVVSGGFLALKWPKTLYAHVPTVLWGVYIEFSGKVCPLTPLENWLRRKAGEGVYQGDFVQHYLLPLIYPPGLTQQHQLVLGTIVIVINTIAYTWLIIKYRK